MKYVCSNCPMCSEDGQKPCTFNDRIPYEGTTPKKCPYGHKAKWIPKKSNKEY